MTIMDQIIHMGLLTPLDFSKKKPKLHNNSNAMDFEESHHTSTTTNNIDTPMDRGESSGSDDDDRRSNHSINVVIEEDSTTAQSPRSHLRNILSMKSPGLPCNEVDSIAVPIALNLTMSATSHQTRIERPTPTINRLWSVPTLSNSKEDSHFSDNDSPGRSCSSNSNNSDYTSSGISSPPSAQVFMLNNGSKTTTHHTKTQQQQQIQPLLTNSSPAHSKMSTSRAVSSTVIPKGSTPSSTLIAPVPISSKVSGLQMNFSPYSVFSQALSPILNQTVPSTSLPLQFHSSPTFFPPQLNTNNGSGTSITHHADNSSTLLTSPFGNNTLLLSPSTANGKSKVTRPFKAYPKDPLSFPTVGIYGLPLNIPQGTTESLIHQQSNHAYAEFRRQMLSQTQGKPIKRLAQHQEQQRDLTTSSSSLLSPTQQQQMQQLLSDSATNLSPDMLNYRLGLMEGASSGEEGSHSNSDEGFGSSDKTRVSNGNFNGCTKLEQQMKDEAYWERRRKNNEAAKRSRDARRAKEDEIAIRAAYLEQENLKLRFEVCTLKNEIAKLRCMLYKA